MSCSVSPRLLHANPTLNINQSKAVIGPLAIQNEDRGPFYAIAGAWYGSFLLVAQEPITYTLGITGAL